jgi:galactokinase
VREIEQRALVAYRDQFGVEPEVVSSAPGRVNLLGEHTDYSGGFVLPCAIGQRVAVALGRGTGPLYTLDLDSAQPLARERTGTWVDYPSGVAWALAEAGLRVPTFQAAFAGEVPHGAGLSSSAAIEAATALALDTLGGSRLERPQLAQRCQRAENAFVGVPSGIMDQYAALCCRAGSALLLDCRSLAAELIPVDLQAAELCLVIGDTRVERRLAATGYAERRATCEAAAQRLGLAQLRDATVTDLARLSGDELRYARHVVTENARVLTGVAALREGDYAAFGQVMDASHTSLRDDFAVSTAELDCMVATARECGALGARLTGAGFGGCAIALIPAVAVGALMAAVDATFVARAFRPPRWSVMTPSAGAEVVG